MLRLCLALFLLIPTPVFAYHVPTQAPSNLTLTVDYENGTVKADWDASDQMEDYPAERYAIGFGLSDEVSLPYGIATGNVGDSNALNTEFTFTASYLNAVFNEAHGLFHVAIRSDNDTNASYSEWTPTVSITIQNKPASVTLASYDMNREDGIKFEWLASTSGFVSASTYKMYYKLSNASEWTLEGQQSNTDYVLAWDNLTDDTYDFMLSACGSENDCNDSNTLTVNVVTYVAPTTTTTTTTVPPKPEPKPEPEPEPYIPPPPPPPTPQEIIVDVKVEGVDKTYTQADVNDGTIERDQERIDNEKEYGCFMTNAQIERGDCDIPELIEEDIKDDIIKEDVVIKEDIVEDKEDVDVIIPKDDVVVLDPPKEEVIKDEVVEFEEPPIEFEIIEFDLEDIAPEIVVEIPVLVEVVKDEPIKEDIPEVLEEDTPDTTLPPVEIKQEREDIVLTEEEVAVEVAEVVEIVKDIVIEEATVEEVVEVLEQVNDIGVQNLSSVTEETQTVIQEVVEEAIADVAELTEEQVEVVAEVLQVEAEDVAIIAESVKDDEVIAEAVEEYVKRAVENADVENYTLADVVTEVQFETFIDNPIQTFIDIDIQEINFSDIGNDMTNDQKEKAQEVVVPVILTRIATMAAFVFRRGNV
ncbi:hypothetical protein N8814_05325 [Acidimicrobiia bacterium]|nr:hypothetical protein [Acidimicrobiia bacterium]